MDSPQNEVGEWICMIAAYSYADESETTFQWFQKAIREFPDHALELDPSLCDAKYSKGFCYEELGEWQKAYETWTMIAEENKRDGCIYEMRYPLKLAENCLRKLKEKT